MIFAQEFAVTTNSAVRNRKFLFKCLASPSTACRLIEVDKIETEEALVIIGTTTCVI